ncbi:MAG: 4-hydroxybutyryl-CoA dehydratase / vinylacetyl-CoA-Delta-isomerase [Solirubrobacteraceae bacterium]
MGLRTASAYRESVRDGRRLIYRGQEVEDVTAHRSLRRTIDHASALFDHPSEGPHDLWTFWDSGLDEEVSAYFKRPTDAAGLRHRGDLIEETTRRARSTLNIIKAVGTDALLGLEQVAPRVDAEHGTDYARRVREFREHCAREDLAMALAATDAKGDRSLPPSAQADPDLHLRVVSRDSQGIVVRGAKLHTTAAPSANELICIPCRAMSEDDAEYALAFAVPLNASGLTMISHPLVDGAAAEHPVSSRNIEVETLTIFDDVHIPSDRVFLCGEHQYAGAVATAFANFHRYTAISYKPPFVDLLIGAAALAADQLGITNASATRDKLARLIVYGELIRTTRLAAAERCTIDELSGLAIPDPVATNAGKYHFASGFHEAVALVQDLAGGLVVTAPGIEDLEHREFGASVEKYLAGRAGVGGRERWELVQLIRDLTASEFGGYNYVVTLHGEGSLGAQLVQSLRTYDVERCVREVRSILDMSAVPAPEPVG